MRISDWSSDVCSSDLEHPQLPAYDLMEQTIGGQSLAHRIAEPRELDPVHPHDARAAQLETFVQIEDRAPVPQGGESRLRIEGLSTVVVGRRRDPSGRDPAADDTLPLIGLVPKDATGFLGTPFPDRHKQPPAEVPRAG